MYWSSKSPPRPPAPTIPSIPPILGRIAIPTRAFFMLRIFANVDILAAILNSDCSKLTMCLDTVAVRANNMVLSHWVWNCLWRMGFWLVVIIVAMVSDGNATDGEKIGICAWSLLLLLPLVLAVVLLLFFFLPLLLAACLTDSACKAFIKLTAKALNGRIGFLLLDLCPGRLLVVVWDLGGTGMVYNAVV